MNKYKSFSGHSDHTDRTSFRISLTFLFELSGIFNGYPTFVISIAFVGLCTAVIGDVAGHLGCFINLKDCVNAIAFVALGTSVPGTGVNPVLLYVLP